ncbi:MAG: RluA family pseudouridine synthase [Eubacteriales bacterium]|nr:RluA family pseudouridine synthase [Eubacteriales bacterium]
MKQFTINANEAGQRFDKYLAKLLKEAPKSFLYKMLRKKNITLNGKKADGTEKLCINDEVKVFLSDETFDKFHGTTTVAYPTCSLNIVYEDKDVLLINKPVGMLAQKAKDSDVSLVEYTIGYLLQNHSITEKELETFKPSICNRLDRNTTGLIAAGKSLAGSQGLSEMFRKRTLHKYYLCLVKGKIDQPAHINGYLSKDHKTNKVTVLKTGTNSDQLPIETRYVPLGSKHNVTLLEVELITGRTHQIRAHLASIGHAIIGDPKYGAASAGEKQKNKNSVKYQLLHSYKLVMPHIEGALHQLSEQQYIAEIPEYFERILKEYNLEESYYAQIKE